MKLGWRGDQIEFAPLEGQPHRLGLFDDRNLDPADRRHAPARHLPDQPLVVRIVAGGEVPDEAPVSGIGREQDLGAADPFVEPVGAGAHRVRHDLVESIVLDHLTRDDAEIVGRQHVQEDEIRA
jgi:hypothetical protein